MSPQELLSLYFAPLSFYSNASQIFSTQPLWLYKQQALTQNGFGSHLANLDLTGTAPQVESIVQCLR